MDHACTPRPAWVAPILWLAIGLIAPPPAGAANLAAIVRAAGRVADDLPVNRIDDVAEDLATSGAARRLVRKAGGAADDAAERGRAVRRLLREAVGDADPAVLRQIDALDEPAREAGLVLARGSRSVRQAIPDLAARGRFVRDGGAETVAALGLYDDLVDDAIRFDGAVRTGRLLAAPGTSRIALEDFGRFIRTAGDRGHYFWTAHVRPHWKLWMGSGALAAVMLAPDDYLDAAGDFTRTGLEKVGRLGGSLLAGALGGLVAGVGSATKETIRETTAAVWSTFFRDAWGILTISVLVVAGLLMIRPVWRKLRSLNPRRGEGVGPASTHLDS
jgi:hypothetical protein